VEIRGPVDKVLGGRRITSKSPKRRRDVAARRVGYDTNLALHRCGRRARRVWTHTTDNYINGSPALLPSGEVMFGGGAIVHPRPEVGGRSGDTADRNPRPIIASSVAVARWVRLRGKLRQPGDRVRSEKRRGEMEISRSQLPVFFHPRRGDGGSRDHRLSRQAPALPSIARRARWSGRSKHAGRWRVRRSCAAMRSSSARKTDGFTTASISPTARSAGLMRSARQWTASARGERWVHRHRRRGRKYLRFQIHPPEPLPQNHEPRSHRNSRTRKSTRRHGGGELLRRQLSTVFLLGRRHGADRARLGSNGLQRPTSRSAFTSTCPSCRKRCISVPSRLPYFSALPIDSDGSSAILRGDPSLSSTKGALFGGRSRFGYFRRHAELLVGLATHLADRSD